MYRWLGHTAEASLEIEAAALEDVFGDVLEALRELLGDGEPGGEPLSREVTVEATDRPALLAEWLAELVFLAEAEGFVPDRIDRLELGPERLHATVSGHLGSPRHLVKAVTYHGLTLAPSRTGWRATVVFDV